LPKLSKHTVFTPNGAKAVQLVRENPNTPNRKEKEMSSRIKKQFWFTPEEEAEFRRKVALTDLPQSSVIRMLIKGYEPRERPDDRFFQAINSINEMIHTAQKLLKRSYQLGVVDKDTVEREIKRWAYFISNIESEFLRPEKSPIKWK